jgi:hypothetical protein
VQQEEEEVDKGEGTEVLPRVNPAAMQVLRAAAAAARVAATAAAAGLVATQSGGRGFRRR